MNALPFHSTRLILFFALATMKAGNEQTHHTVTRFKKKLNYICMYECPVLMEIQAFRNLLVNKKLFQKSYITLSITCVCARAQKEKKRSHRHAHVQRVFAYI